MIQSEQILEYIDGMLDPDSEQALFDALARQPELRGAMRQFITIGEAVRADREAYTPPAETERALMAGIGLSAEELGLVPAIGFMERLSAIAGRYLGLVGAFVLGLLLASVTTYVIVDGGERNGAAIAVATGARSGNGNDAMSDGARRGSATSGGGMNGTAMIGTATNGTATNGSASNTGSTNAGSTSNDRGTTSQFGAPRMTSPSGTGAAGGANERTASIGEKRGDEALSSPNRSSSSTNVRRSRSASNDHLVTARSSDGARRSARVERSDRSGANASITSASGDGASREPRSSDASAISSSTPPDVVPATANVDPATPRRDLAFNGGASSHAEIETRPAPREMMLESAASTPLADAADEDTHHGALLELRGQMGWSLNESNAKAVGSSGRNAFAAGAYWQALKNLSIGAEGGMESYDQTLRYRDGDTLQIDQRPSYLWGGVALRYYLGALPIDGFEPFVQTTFGGTSAGPLLRLRLGTEYDLGLNTSLSLSGEFSSLFYSFDKQRLTSGRMGLTAGLQYNFR